MPNIHSIWVVFHLCLVIKPICTNYHKLSILLIKLCNDYLKSQNTQICLQLERMTSDGFLDQNRCRSKLSFQLLKRLFLCIPPCELIMNLVQLSSRFGNSFLPKVECKPHKKQHNTLNQHIIGCNICHHYSNPFGWLVLWMVGVQLHQNVSLGKNPRAFYDAPMDVKV